MLIRVKTNARLLACQVLLLMRLQLRDIAASVHSPVESRLFAEYGAVFVTTAVPPPTILFRDSQQVELFQAALSVGGLKFGDYEVELQAQAMEALNSAAEELSERGQSLSARAADAGRRSYDDSVRLWTRNVTRGLQHWEGQGRMDPARARSIRELAPAEQVAVILELEETELLYFGTFFDKSILYSVAAPGASQHLSLLAFDAAEYQDGIVEIVFERHGWFRTVINDLPHFTYLGRREEELIGLGLERVVRSYGDSEYHFWIPDVHGMDA